MEVLSDGYTCSLGKPLGYAPLGRPTRWLEGNLSETVDRLKKEPPTDRVYWRISVSAVLNLRVPLRDCLLPYFIIVLQYRVNTRERCPVDVSGYETAWAVSTNIDSVSKGYMEFLISVATNLWCAALVLYLTEPRISSNLKYKRSLINFLQPASEVNSSLFLLNKFLSFKL